MNTLSLTKNRGIALAVFPFLAIALLLASAPFQGCGRKQDAGNKAGAAVDTSDIYTLEVMKDRKQKDLSFLQDEGSPLLPEQRDTFSGLNYFPPDKRFAFATVLHRLPSPESIVMATSKDRPREMFHIGWLPFMHEGREYRLEVYMPADTVKEKSWFIPFMDASSGVDCYGGGRFLDIDNPKSDSTFLDFNYAYNPYCAYNERWNCPIPPKENRLPFAVRAGEKSFRAGH